jgi:transposase-like protein
VTRVTTAEDPSPLRRRVCRQRNKPLAAWRKARAVELATQGCSYEVIAREVGYTNRRTAYRAVQESLNEHADKAVAEHRATVLARLDRLLAAIWKQALNGDLQAIAEAHSIVLSQARLHGLGAPVKRTTPQHGKSVVLTPEELAHYHLPQHKNEPAS